MVLTVVQFATCVRALRLARDSRSGSHYNFYNYTHTLLVLMLWVLPINMPVLIVWVHNLAVRWLTPFGTSQNLLAVVPLVVLVELTSTGTMLVRTPGRYVKTHALPAAEALVLTLRTQSSSHHQRPELPLRTVRSRLRGNVRVSLAPPLEYPRSLAGSAARCAKRIRSFHILERINTEHSTCAASCGEVENSGERCQEATLDRSIWLFALVYALRA